MKKGATQESKQTLEADPADNVAAGARDRSTTVGADNDQDLAELVWKHCRDEITQALQDAQQALTPAKGLSTPGNSQKR